MQQILEKQKNTIRTSFYRWIFLILVVVYSLCVYFCFLMAPSMQEQYQEDLELTLFQYNMINMCVGLPNIFLQFVGGVLIDRLGQRLSLIIIVTLSFTGQFIAYCGFLFDLSSHDKYICILIGTCIFGIGISNSFTAINSLIALWFAGQESSLALSVLVASNCGGQILSGQLQPLIYKKFNNSLGSNMLTAVIVISIAWILVLFIFALDKKRYNQEQQTLEQEQEQELEEAQKNPDFEHRSSVRFSEDSLEGSDDRESNVSDVSSVKKPLLTEKKQDIQVQKPQVMTCGIVIRKIINDVKQFPAIYWCIALSGATFFGSTNPLQQNLQGALVNKYFVESELASHIFVVPLAIQLVFMPMGGLFCDKFGKRGQMALIGSLLLFGSYFLFAFLTCDSEKCYVSYYLPMALLGFGNIFLKVFIVPSMNLTMPKQLKATGFGIFGTITSAFNAFSPILAVKFQHIFVPGETQQDKADGFKYFCLFLFGMAVITFLMNIIIYVKDKKNKNLLDLTMKKIQEKMAAQQQQQQQK